MKHENGYPPDAVLRRPNGPDESVELGGLEMLANGGGELLDSRGGPDVLDGNGALGALGEPGGDLGGGRVVDLRQLVENAAR